MVRVVRASQLLADVPAEVRSAALPENFPFLISDETEEVIEPALLYLAGACMTSGRGFVLNTAVAIAEDLKDWWSYLEAFGKPWNAASTEDVIYYRDVMGRTISPKTHEPYANTTIKRRIGTVLGFYTWAEREQLIDGPIDRRMSKVVRISRDKRAMSHVQSDPTAGTVSAIMPKSRGDETKARCLLPAQVRAVFAELGPLPSERGSANLRSSRGRLAAEMPLNCGLRAAESRNLTVYDFQALVFDRSEPMRLVPLRVLGKGNKMRTVSVPVWLVLEILNYIDHERAEAMAARAAGSRQGKKRLNPHPGLWVNPVGSGGVVGSHTSKRALQDAFTKAVRAAGLVEIIQKTDPEIGQVYFEQQPRFSLHDLRHTFAVWTYYARRRQGDSEPWIYIQKQLGHQDLDTTMNTYLRIVGEFENVVSDAIAQHFNEIRSE